MNCGYLEKGSEEKSLARKITIYFEDRKKIRNFVTVYIIYVRLT